MYQVTLLNLILIHLAWHTKLYISLKSLKKHLECISYLTRIPLLPVFYWYIAPTGNMHYRLSIIRNVHFSICVHKECMCFFFKRTGKQTVTEGSLEWKGCVMIVSILSIKYHFHPLMLIFNHKIIHVVIVFFITFYCLCLRFSCDSGGDCECLCTAIAAYAEECNRRGVYTRWRSQELCRMSKTLTQLILSTFTPVCNLCFLTWSCLFFINSLQLCSVRTGWCMIPVVQLALPHVPVYSRVHTPSVALSPVWRAASALLAWSDTVSQIYQTSPEPPGVMYTLEQRTIMKQLMIRLMWIFMLPRG